MFLDEQTINDYHELNDEFADFITDTAAIVTPITSVFGSSRRYKDEVSDWNDVLDCLLFV